MLSKVVLSIRRKGKHEYCAVVRSPAGAHIDQAAAVLQINRRTLTNMLDCGALRGVKIGKEWRVSRAEMMRFVEGNGTKTSPMTTSVDQKLADSGQ